MCKLNSLSAVMAASLSTVAALANVGHAAAINTGAGGGLGDLIVYRVGTVGSGTALTTAATAVFLDEYTLSGTLVQSIALPTTGTGEVTAAGSAAAEGIISRSANSNLIVFGGYRRDAGLTDPSATPGTTSPRVLGTLDFSGNLNTATAVTSDAGTTATINAIRSVGSTDGSSFYYGTTSQVRYVPTVASTTSTLIETRNSRQVIVTGTAANPSFFAASGSSSAIAKVYSYGTPPTAAATGTGIVTFPTAADAANGIFFLDLDSTVAGVDTLYVTDVSASSVVKYRFDGTTWISSGTVTGVTALNLTGVVGPDGNINLFLTSAASLQRIVDTSPTGGTFGGTFAANGGTIVATASTNTAFRGVAFVPEPTTLAALGGVASLALSRRRTAR